LFSVIAAPPKIKKRCQLVWTSTLVETIVAARPSAEARFPAVADDPEQSPVKVPPGSIEAIDPNGAPFVYFDMAPVFGVLDGVVRVTLVAQRPIPTKERVAGPMVVSGYLRCGLRAAQELRDALDQALHLASKAKGQAH
jgi:hypothetical protein